MLGTGATTSKHGDTGAEGCDVSCAKAGTAAAASMTVTHFIIPES